MAAECVNPDDRILIYAQLWPQCEQQWQHVAVRISAGWLHRKQMYVYINNFNPINQNDSSYDLSSSKTEICTPQNAPPPVTVAMWP